MTKTKNAASAATAKPCPHPDDQYTIPLVETHRGSVLVRSDFADVTRDAVADRRTQRPDSHARSLAGHKARRPILSRCR